MHSLKATDNILYLYEVNKLNNLCSWLEATGDAELLKGFIRINLGDLHIKEVETFARDKLCTNVVRSLQQRQLFELSSELTSAQQLYRTL